MSCFWTWIEFPQIQEVVIVAQQQCGISKTHPPPPSQTHKDFTNPGHPIDTLKAQCCCLDCMLDNQTSRKTSICLTLYPRSASRSEKYEQAKPFATFQSRQQLFATLLWQFNYSLSYLHYCLFPCKDEWEDKVWRGCFLDVFLITSLERKHLQFVVSDCGGFIADLAELLLLLLALSDHSTIKHHRT